MKDRMEPFYCLVPIPHGKWALKYYYSRYFYRDFIPAVDTIGEYDTWEEARADIKHLRITIKPENPHGC